MSFLSLKTNSEDFRRYKTDNIAALSKKEEAFVSSATALPLQRKASCSCGGDCPRCQNKTANLPVSQPNDASETEADNLADKVMRMSDRDVLPVGGFYSSDNVLQGKKSGGEKPLRKKERSNSAKLKGLSSVGSISESGGIPLSKETREFFEPRFGYDFSDIRIFNDERAAQSAQSVSALAYTFGDKIVFNRNQYQPETESGKKLLAHELAHTLQQSESILKRRAIHTGRILNEGSCQHLACNSRWACDDPDGVLCPEGTRNAGKKKRPLFTCDVNCENNIPCGTNYMAIPHSRFRGIRGGQCGQDLVICANGRFTHGIIRDRSEREAWEVSPGILSAVGVTTGDITNGAIYPDESDSDFLSDSRCRQSGGGTTTPPTGTSGSILPDAGLPDQGNDGNETEDQ